jgi:hypothetical protein
MAKQVEAGMRVIEKRYGAENVRPWDDWTWGYVHGKLAALRWVLGSEWDFSTRRYKSRDGPPKRRVAVSFATGTTGEDGPAAQHRWLPPQAGLRVPAFS